LPAEALANAGHTLYKAINYIALKYSASCNALQFLICLRVFALLSFGHQLQLQESLAFNPWSRLRFLLPDFFWQDLFY
jgi:hypothetical protein